MRFVRNMCVSPRGNFLGVLKMCKISSSRSSPWLIIHTILIHDMMGVCFYIEGGIPSTRPRQAGSTGKDKYQTLAFIALRSFSSSVTVHTVCIFPRPLWLGEAGVWGIDSLIDFWWHRCSSPHPSDFHFYMTENHLILWYWMAEHLSLFVWPCFFAKSQELKGCVDGFSLPYFRKDLARIGKP